jgi:hypothetical protein
MARVKQAAAYLLPVLLWFMSSSVSADRSIACEKRGAIPSLDYTISPHFIWLPSDANPSEITQTFRNAIYSALQEETRPPQDPSSTTSSSPSASTPTAYHPPPRPIRATIQNFLETPCTLFLTVTPGPFAHASASLNLFNETLQDTDLLCRLATHKIGRTYTDNPHIMMTSHFRASVHYPQNRTLRASRMSRRSVKRQLTSVPRPIPGIEYRLSCPRQQTENPQPQLQRPGPGPPPGPLNPLEGLTGVAMMKDCGWCKMIGQELQGLCSIDSSPVASNTTSNLSSNGTTGSTSINGLEPMNNDPVAIAGLADMMRKAGWAFGGTNCIGCA